MPRYHTTHHPDVVMISEDVITDQRMSSADLGVYVRFAQATTLYHSPDLDLLVREFHMPREETEAALLRLVALGHLQPLRDRGSDKSSD